MATPNTPMPSLPNMPGPPPNMQGPPPPINGGDGGASGFGVNAYGSTSNQHAIPGQGNVIAVQKGGGQQLSKQQLQKAIQKQLQQLKQSGGNLAFSEIGASAPVATANGQATVVNGMKGGNGPDVFPGQQSASFSQMANAFKQSGGKLSKQQLSLFSQQLDKLQQNQQGGVGLNEIIVPLILLYATQRYSQGRTFKSKQKFSRKSMRRSRRFRR